MDRIEEFKNHLFTTLSGIEAESAQLSAEMSDLKREVDRTNSYLALIEAHHAKAAKSLSSISFSLYILVFFALITGYKLL